MALYELRTYTLYVGKMAEAVKLYQQFGFPALDKGGHAKHQGCRRKLHFKKAASKLERRAEVARRSHASLSRRGGRGRFGGAFRHRCRFRGRRREGANLFTHWLRLRRG